MIVVWPQEPLAKQQKPNAKPSRLQRRPPRRGPASRPRGREQGPSGPPPLPTSSPPLPGPPDGQQLGREAAAPAPAGGRPCLQEGNPGLSSCGSPGSCCFQPAFPPADRMGGHCPCLAQGRRWTGHPHGGPCGAGPQGSRRWEGLGCLLLPLRLGGGRLAGLTFSRWLGSPALQGCASAPGSPFRCGGGGTPETEAPAC